MTTPLIRTCMQVALGLLLAAGLNAARAQAANPPGSFALIGHIERFTLDTPGLQTSAAHVTVRGIDVLLPANLIITMTGGYLTAEQLFRGRDFKSPSVPPRSGLALAEMTDADMACPPPPFAPPGAKCPLPAGEIELAGNIIDGQYRAGIARISQGGLHIGSGFIRSIDKVTGFFTVGADVAGGTTARLRFNDPDGIYGPRPALGLVDQRFALDPGNSPVHARTGYPVCIEDSARPGLCPAGNRATDATAANYRRFTCGNAPAGNTEPVLPGCKPHLPIPLREGDYVNYVGMLDKDATGYFVSLHGLEAELGVYTSPGVDPAYVFVEEAIQGTLGARYALDATNTIPQEETARYKIVGFTTDPSRTVSVDIFDDDANSNPLNPTFAPTRLATRIVPTNLAQLGRFKMIWAAKEDARVVRRNVRVLLSPATLPSDAAFGPGKASNEMPPALLPTGASKRSGYAFGQYEAPVAEYISPEITRFGVKGWPVPVNFEDFCFLKTTNLIDTQEPTAAGYVQVTAGPATPSPAARLLSQRKADGTRVCGEP
jgi:hypothetical protein